MKKRDNNRVKKLKKFSPIPPFIVIAMISATILVLVEEVVLKKIFTLTSINGKNI